MVSVLCGFQALLPAQNLAPNPSFEQYVDCPAWPAPGGPYPLEAIPWYGVQGSADYYNACAPGGFFGVPVNWLSYQEAHTGVGYAGGYYYIPYSQDNTREFIQAPLLDTMEAGVCYEVGVWMNLPDRGCACNRVGILLSNGPVGSPLGLAPQVDYMSYYVNDREDWVYVFDYYLAIGNETYITIGNFYDDAQTGSDPDCPEVIPWNFTYYFMDDVVVQPVPEEVINIDLGPPATACDSFVIDPGTPGVVYYWSTGHIGPTLTVYTSGTYSVTASFACETYEAEIEVTIIAGNQVDMGPPAIDLCAGETYAIALDPELGTYTWQDGSDGPDYVIESGGTYMVTLDDGCRETSDTMEVMFFEPPEPFTLGEDTAICEGESIVLAFDPALGDFTWQDGSGATTYTIEEEGEYALTISNMCGEVTDDLSVEILYPPVVEIGPDEVLLCDGGIYDINLDPDEGDYVWSDGTTGPAFTLIDPGMVGVTVTNTCGVAEDDVLVLTGVTPAIDLGPDIEACPGDTVLLSAPPIPGNTQWQDGSNGPTYAVTGGGTYWLSIGNLCGMDADTVEVAYAPVLAVPDLGPDLTLCPGETAILSVDGTGGSVQWSDMSTADTLLVTSAGVYAVQVTNACFDHADTVVVTVNSDPPMVSLPADFALCAGARDTLDAVVTGVSYLWSDGSLMQQLAIDAPGTYAVTVSNACGVDADTVVVTAGEPLPTVELGPDTALCTGELFEIIPEYSNVAEWMWHDGSTQSTLTTAAPAEVTVVCFNTCGAATDTLLLSLLPATPALDLGPDTALCPGESVTLTIGVTGVDILWSDGTTGSTLLVDQAGTYHAMIVDACGMSVDTVIVDPLPPLPALDLGPDQTICPGETVIIDPGMGADVDYTWQDGSTDPIYAATQGGWIALTITNACGTTTDSLLLTETTDGPQLDLGPDQQACTGETVTIPAGIGGVSYAWSDGTTGSSLTVTSSGSYSLTVSNACGTDSDTVMVDISGQAPDVFLGPDTTLCEAETLLLTVTAGAETTITWQDNNSGMTYLVTMPGIYSVRAVNRCGTDADSIDVDYIVPPEPFALGPDTVLCPGQSVTLYAPATLDEIEWHDGSTGSTYVADREGTYALRVSNRCGIAEDSLAVFVLADEPVVDLGPDHMWCPGDTFLLDATQPFPASYVWSTGATTPTLLAMRPGVYRVDVSTPCVTAEGTAAIDEEEDCFPAPEIYVPNVFSPNGDGINDIFTVATHGEAEILGMEGTIFDRWGNMVHQASANPFTWDGQFHDEAMDPAVFVYMVTIRYRVDGMEFIRTIAGDLTLLR